MKKTQFVPSQAGLEPKIVLYLTIWTVILFLTHWSLVKQKTNDESDLCVELDNHAGFPQN